MDQGRPDSSADALVRFLNALITDKEPRPIEELRESVKAMGMDPDQLIARARERVADAHEKARLSWVVRAQARLPKIRQRLADARSSSHLGRNELLRRIRDAAGGAFGMPAREFAAAHHKLEDLPDADLASLVDDIEALRLLEEEPGDERA